MNKKTKIIIIVSIIVLVLLVILYFVFFYKSSEQLNNDSQQLIDYSLNYPSYDTQNDHVYFLNTMYNSENSTIKNISLQDGLVNDILNLDYRYDGATELITFIDNHDMHRFQTLNPDPEALHLAVVLLMTTRGIPCLFYGTEQYLHDDTNGNSDPYGNNDPYNRPMMESWDTETKLYRDIRLLSGLRRLNPAVSLGSQWQKFSTSDVYCYVRRYRDSRLFVALNRGESTDIEEVTTELPDGEHTCVLTRRKFEVKDGKIYSLKLETKDAIVISHVGERVKGQTIVRVQLNGVNTLPGETVVITGNCPELGNWDIASAYPLEYVNKNTWFAEIPFNESAGKQIVFKYAMWREGKAPLRENLAARRWVLKNEGTVKWRDRWVS